MKKFRKVLCLTLALMLVLAALSGCGEKKTSNADGQVQLKWVFGGPGKLEDSDRVWAAFNEKLGEYLPNTSVEFMCIPHADYAEKWRLMSASQETVDIAWISWALNFADEVAKGSYMDITELINQYGQDMVKELPEWLLKLTTIDGKIYAIPNYQMMTNPTGFSIDTSHVEKGWLDIQAAEDLLCSDKVLRKEDYKIFEDYFNKVLESGEKVKYVSTQFLNRAIKNRIGLPYKGTETITCNAAIKIDADDYKVYNMLTDFPEIYEYYDLVHEWYKKGITRKDILENPVEKEGDYLLWWTTTLKGAKERLEIKLGKPMEIFAQTNQLYVPYNGSTTNTAIPATCQNPERAMQLLNLMNSSKGAELLNLLSYGFEGEHYNKMSDDRIEWLGNNVPGSSNNKYGYENWALGNALVSYTTQSDPEGWNEYIHNDINMNAEISRLVGFTFDQTPVRMQIAQYNAVMKEYAYLDKGTTENYKELLAERNEKLVAAGSEEIVKEVQRQLDEWVKTKKQ